MTTPSVSLPIRLTTACAGMLLAVTSVGLATPSTSAATTKTVSVTAKSNTYESKVMKRINQLRAARGMKRVKMANCQDSYAETGARSNARAGSLTHQDLSPIMNSCKARWAGEVIAAGTRMGARATVRMWMHSPGHKAIIMKRSIRRIGVGAFVRGGGQVFISAVAGR